MTRKTGSVQAIVSGRRRSMMRRLLLRGVSAAENLRLWLLDQRLFRGALAMLPRQLRWILRTVYLAPVDRADRLLGRCDPALPPKASRFTGGVRDFAASGRLTLGALQSAAGVTPSSRILDIGCGIGRLAVAMPGFLNADGAYEGLDIVPAGIEWCRQHIVSPHGNVHFTLADVYNREYSPRGCVRAADYQFPYEDGTFDAAVLVSVFTHMLPPDFDRYVSEIARVLKKNGRIFATYFIITAEAVAASPGRCPPPFKHKLGPCWVQSRRVPEFEVAYDEQYLRQVYSRYGFSDPPKIYFGQWSGKPGHWPAGSGLCTQDTVVATKL